MANIEFHHNHFRNKSQPYSEDTFQVILNEIIEGCLDDPDTYCNNMLEKYKGIEFSDSINFSSPKDGKTVVFVDIGFACHVLYSLLADANQEQEDKIYTMLEEIDLSISPRIGQIIKRPISVIYVSE